MPVIVGIDSDLPLEPFVGSVDPSRSSEVRQPSALQSTQAISASRSKTGSKGVGKEQIVCCQRRMYPIIQYSQD